MKIPVLARILVSILGVVLTVNFASSQFLPGGGTSSAYSVPVNDLIQPQEVNEMLQKHAIKPFLLFHVGSHMMYTQAHIPHSEYIGPGAQPAGIEALKKRVASVDKKTLIILYCGCCPWDRCPNVAPTYQTLHSMGYNVKVLQMPTNFGVDWVSKGYAIEKGQ